MPEPNPTAGRTFIWAISCILFICIAAGGGCLLAYMTNPEQSSVLLPALGFTLVCMPWIFWILTVVYRIMSRAFGFRMVIGSLYNSGNVTTAKHNCSNASGGDGAQILDVNTKLSPASSPKNNGGHAQNVDIIGEEINIKRSSSSSSTSSNDISRNSHESERPLALSMPS